MDISATWKKLESERLGQPIGGDFTNSKQSYHPVAKLKRNYFLKSMMMIVFLVAFIMLFVLFDQFLIRVTLAIVVGAYTVFLISSLSMYKDINSELPMDKSLLHVLTSTKEQIEKALKFETISSLLIYPFAGTAGYMIGYTVSGKNISRIFESNSSIGIFIGTLVAFGVLGYFLGRKLTKEGYGKSLDEISKLIEQLKAA